MAYQWSYEELHTPDSRDCTSRYPIAAEHLLVNASTSTTSLTMTSHNQSSHAAYQGQIYYPLNRSQPSSRVNRSPSYAANHEPPSSYPKNPDPPLHLNNHSLTSYSHNPGPSYPANHGPSSCPPNQGSSSHPANHSISSYVANHALYYGQNYDDDVDSSFPPPRVRHGDDDIIRAIGMPSQDNVVRAVARSPQDDVVRAISRPLQDYTIQSVNWPSQDDIIRSVSRPLQDDIIRTGKPHHDNDICQTACRSLEVDRQYFKESGPVTTPLRQPRYEEDIYDEVAPACNEQHIMMPVWRRRIDDISALNLRFKGAEEEEEMSAVRRLQLDNVDALDYRLKRDGEELSSVRRPRPDDDSITATVRRPREVDEVITAPRMPRAVTVDNVVVPVQTQRLNDDDRVAPVHRLHTDDDIIPADHRFRVDFNAMESVRSQAGNEVQSAVRRPHVLDYDIRDSRRPRTDDDYIAPDRKHQEDNFISPPHQLRHAQYHASAPVRKVCADDLIKIFGRPQKDVVACLVRSRLRTDDDQITPRPIMENNFIQTPASHWPQNKTSASKSTAFESKTKFESNAMFEPNTFESTSPGDKGVVRSSASGRQRATVFSIRLDDDDNSKGVGMAGRVAEEVDTLWERPRLPPRLQKRLASYIARKSESPAKKVVKTGYRGIGSSTIENGRRAEPRSSRELGNERVKKMVARIETRNMSDVSDDTGDKGDARRRNTEHKKKDSRYLRTATVSLVTESMYSSMETVDLKRNVDKVLHKARASTAATSTCPHRQPIVNEPSPASPSTGSQRARAIAKTSVTLLSGTTGGQGFKTTSSSALCEELDRTRGGKSIADSSPLSTISYTLLTGTVFSASESIDQTPSSSDVASSVRRPAAGRPRRKKFGDTSGEMSDESSCERKPSFGPLRQRLPQTGCLELKSNRVPIRRSLVARSHPLESSTTNNNIDVDQTECHRTRKDIVPSVTRILGSSTREAGASRNYNLALKPDFKQLCPAAVVPIKRIFAIRTSKGGARERTKRDINWCNNCSSPGIPLACRPDVISQVDVVDATLRGQGKIAQDHGIWSDSFENCGKYSPADKYKHSCSLTFPSKYTEPAAKGARRAVKDGNVCIVKKASHDVIQLLSRCGANNSRWMRKGRKIAQSKNDNHGTLDYLLAKSAELKQRLASTAVKTTDPVVDFNEANNFRTVTHTKSSVKSFKRTRSAEVPKYSSSRGVLKSIKFTRTESSLRKYSAVGILSENYDTKSTSPAHHGNRRAPAVFQHRVHPHTLSPCKQHVNPYPHPINRYYSRPHRPFQNHVNPHPPRQPNVNLHPPPEKRKPTYSRKFRTQSQRISLPSIAATPAFLAQRQSSVAAKSSPIKPNEKSQSIAINSSIKSVLDVTVRSTTDLRIKSRIRDSHQPVTRIHSAATTSIILHSKSLVTNSSRCVLSLKSRAKNSRLSVSGTHSPVTAKTSSIFSTKSPKSDISVSVTREHLRVTDSSILSIKSNARNTSSSVTQTSSPLIAASSSIFSMSSTSTASNSSAVLRSVNSSASHFTSSPVKKFVRSSNVISSSSVPFIATVARKGSADPNVERPALKHPALKRFAITSLSRAQSMNRTCPDGADGCRVFNLRRARVRCLSSVQGHSESPTPYPSGSFACQPTDLIGSLSATACLTSEQAENRPKDRVLFHLTETRTVSDDDDDTTTQTTNIIGARAHFNGANTKAAVVNVDKFEPEAHSVGGTDVHHSETNGVIMRMSSDVILTSGDIMMASSDVITTSGADSLKAACRGSATYTILTESHPSSSSTPTDDDDDITANSDDISAATDYITIYTNKDDTSVTEYVTPATDVVTSATDDVISAASDVTPATDDVTSATDDVGSAPHNVTASATDVVIETSYLLPDVCCVPCRKCKSDLL